MNSITATPNDEHEPSSTVLAHPDNTYDITHTRTKSLYDSLVDRGANGGLADTDMRLIKYDDDRTIDNY